MVKTFSQMSLTVSHVPLIKGNFIFSDFLNSLLNSIIYFIPLDKFYQSIQHSQFLTGFSNFQTMHNLFTLLTHTLALPLFDMNFLMIQYSVFFLVLLSIFCSLACPFSVLYFIFRLITFKCIFSAPCLA